MGLTKTIACFANSRKLSGRCLAGKELIGPTVGQWIRPVSARPSEEVSEPEREYEDGSDPRVLDIIRVPLLEPRPKTFHSENWLLDPGYYWVREGKLSWADVAKYCDSPDILWQNQHSTSNGLNDQLPEGVADTFATSLYLLRVDAVTVHVLVTGGGSFPAKRRVQARFKFKSVDYWLWVTDPGIERTYKAMPNGKYPLGTCFLTVSLGERFNGYCYKLVAAVIQQGEI